MMIGLRNNIIVRRPSDFTVSWAQGIVAQQYAGVSVSRVDVICMDVGTTSRFRIAVDHDGPDSLPRRWFVKIPSMARRARIITALAGLLHAEVRFYKEVSRLIPVTHPLVLAAESKPGWGSTLVLADVTEGGSVPGSPGDRLTASQATLVVEELAHLHARFWNQEHLEQVYGWLAHPVRRVEDQLGAILAVPLMKCGLRLAGRAIAKSLHLPAIHYAKSRRRIMHSLEIGPRTLVHHDCHPGNIFWHQAKPGFLDWQLIRQGDGIGDIAYFLATALDPNTRRAHENNLVGHYKDVLTGLGVKDITTSKLMQRYRAHLVYPFEAMVLTLAIGGMMDIQDNLELIRRTSVAVQDHEAFKQT